VSRYSDPVILARAVFLRGRRGKGVRRAIREAKRIEADARNAATPEERRSKKTQRRENGNG
jgi:hypothetical protein